MIFHRSFWLILLAFFSISLRAANPDALPLRYFPVGSDFVITNGTEFFNRPLYGGHTAFRVDAGDVPEFSLYLPGRGGNLRLGLRVKEKFFWLSAAKEIITHYRAGKMSYEIRDPSFPASVLQLEVQATRDSDGMILCTKFIGENDDVELLLAFGGVNGMRGQRAGDIGCEREPVSRFFQLRSEQCISNQVTLETNSFLVRGQPGVICGTIFGATKLSVASALNWVDAEKLFLPIKLPVESLVVAGQIKLRHGEKCYIGLQKNESATSVKSVRWSPEQLAEVFSKAESQRRAIAERVKVTTPDAFVNAAAGALNLAADAIWDESQSAFMHGAVAWRQRLLGWRGPYVGDELGWHERTAKHFLSYAAQQNTNEIKVIIPASETSANLARNENALHSNGDLMNRSHYDMNLLAVDAFFRHLLWTGDLDFARTNWPVIERHFAWERRLFRREFGSEKLPLYEGYAAIWASDDLSYNGGGATHASALNFFANKMAARVAKLIGKNAEPYEREANLIQRAMRQFLWLPKEQNFAEYKDFLGRQLVHPNAAVWTFYHTLDSEVPAEKEAAKMADWVEQNLAHIPVGNLPDLNEEKKAFVLPTTSWLPYQWSLNNVVVAENAHTALGFWQAHRAETAFALFKGTLLSTMFCGLCPGNVGCMTAQDTVRGEAQRDFGDGIGAVSRALVEGLFGVKPDVLAGELKIVPGFPAAWNSAQIEHPDFNFEFSRSSAREFFFVESKFSKPMAVRLQIPTWQREVVRVTVNGSDVKWMMPTNGLEDARLEIQCVAVITNVIMVEWKNSMMAKSYENIGEFKHSQPPSLSNFQANAEQFDWREIFSATTKWETISLTNFFNDSVTELFRHEYRSPRSPFCSLATPIQGIGSWCHPQASFRVDDSGLRSRAEKLAEKIILPNGVPLATPSIAAVKNIAFVSEWDNFPSELSVPLAGKATRAFLMLAGSTSAMQSQFDNGEIVVTYADDSTSRLALRNPINWWPIDQDYFVDDFAFARPEPLPMRVDLATGKIRVLAMNDFKFTGKVIPGGAATVLEFPLMSEKPLKSLTIRALANEVVIGLMSVTLQR